MLEIYSKTTTDGFGIVQQLRLLNHCSINNHIKNYLLMKKHFRDNGAMIEVFYEQLNFEMLTESEAYGVRTL